MEEIRHIDPHNPKQMAMQICEYILTVTQDQTELESLDTYAFLLALIATPPTHNADCAKVLMTSAVRAREYLIRTHYPNRAKNPNEKG